jgi:hypothetical protein
VSSGQFSLNQRDARSIEVLVQPWPSASRQNIFEFPPRLPAVVLAQARSPTVASDRPVVSL